MLVFCPDKESSDCEILMMAQNNFKIFRFCINIYSSDSKGYSNSEYECDTVSDIDSDSDSDSNSDSYRDRP